MAAPLPALLVGKPRSAGSLRREQAKRSAQEGAMSSLTLVRRIKARPQVVFDAVTTAEGIAHWWGPDAGPVLVSESDPRVGGCYRLRFRTVPGAEHECSGEFLVVDPPKRVVMSWRWTDGGDDPGESQVEMILRPIDVGTELTFT